MSTCATCAADPKAARDRYCAPNRCYCGHETCPAFASWRERAELNVTFIEPKASTAWADREESTWIDKM